MKKSKASRHHAAGALKSRAYRAASRCDVHELRALPLFALKSAQHLMLHHVRDGQGAWDEPLKMLQDLISEMERGGS